jgi:hypothetical protein
VKKREKGRTGEPGEVDALGSSSPHRQRRAAAVAYAAPKTAGTAAARARESAAVPAAAAGTVREPGGTAYDTDACTAASGSSGLQPCPNTSRRSTSAQAPPGPSHTGPS